MSIIKNLTWRYDKHEDKWDITAKPEGCVPILVIGGITFEETARLICDEHNLVLRFLEALEKQR